MGDIPGHSAPVIRHKRIGGAFLAKRRHGAVATDKANVIPEREQLFPDRVNQGVVIAFREIRAANGTIEQHVTHLGQF